MCVFNSRDNRSSLSDLVGAVSQACVFVFFFLQLVEDNLKAFNSAIVGEVTLFQVETLLAVPDVVLHPAANEVYKLTLQCVRDSVEG